jgi:arsenate reductase
LTTVTERDKKRLRLLFLCTGNSCRSQMAEAWTRALRGDVIEPHSAGVEARGIDPRAAAVMQEVGLDLAGQRSKRVDELGDQRFDYVVTVCDHAAATCPAFPAETAEIHAGFDDPPRLASEARTEQEALTHYRRVRDEIRRFVESFPASLDESRGRPRARPAPRSQ